MKKIFSLIVVFLLATIYVSARDRISRNINDLPQAARTTLAKHFPKQGVNHIKIDKKTFGGADYDVVLNNGTEVEFNYDGEWTEIDCGSNSVPAGLIIKPISDYVNRNFDKQKIVSIDKERNKYTVELLSGTELEFDRSGKFLRVDD